MPAKRILIVEDDPVGRTVVVTALKNRGYHTAVAVDAMAALPEARKQQPDLIVLDLGLPAGGGFAFMQRLQQFPAMSGIPILVVSGLDRRTNEPRAMQAGAARYIQKPVAPQDVVAAVDEILGQSQPAVSQP